MLTVKNGPPPVGIGSLFVSPPLKYPSTKLRLSKYWYDSDKGDIEFVETTLSKPFKVIKQFNAETYGGKRMWLRCIAQKTI